MSISFSVILVTMGLMAGFDESVKNGLRDLRGDFSVQSLAGTFTVNSYLDEYVRSSSVKSFITFYTLKGFIVTGSETGRASILKAINSEEFNQFTGLSINIAPGECYLGEGLLSLLQVAIGDHVSFIYGSDESTTTPKTLSLKIAGTIKHNLYEADTRTLYVNKKLLSLNGKINQVDIRLSKSETSLDDIEEEIEHFNNTVGRPFFGTPFWRDYSALIKAVNIQKLSMGIILQLIVLMAIFNVFSLFIYLKEQKSEDIFLLQALGVGPKSLDQATYLLAFLIWSIAGIVSYYIAQFVNRILVSGKLFKLPQDVYKLEKLHLSITPYDLILVLGPAFIVMLAACHFGLRSIKKESILSGLKKEFF